MKEFREEFLQELKKIAKSLKTDFVPDLYQLKIEEYDNKWFFTIDIESAYAHGVDEPYEQSIRFFVKQKYPQLKFEKDLSQGECLTFLMKDRFLKIDPNKTVSFDVDCQKGFTPLCPKELPVPGGDEIVSALNEQALWADYRVGSKDAHPPNAYWNLVDGYEPGDPIESLTFWKEHIDRFKDVKNFDNIDLYWPSHCVVGTSGFELLDGLPNITEYDFFVYKGIEKEMHPYSAVYHDLTEKLSTGVIEWARSKGIDTFIIGGLALNYCVIYTAIHLKEAGFNVIVNLPATRSIGKPVEEVVSEFEPKGIIFINSLNELSF